jgi:hypothetical protein
MSPGPLPTVKSNLTPVISLNIYKSGCGSRRRRRRRRDLNLAI